MRPIEIDPRFRQMGQGARRRRQRVAAIRWGAGLSVLSVSVALGGWLWRPDLSFWRGGDLDEGLVQVESQFDIAPAVRADTFTDIPGDPLIIAAPDDSGPRDSRDLPAPAELAGRIAGGRSVTMLDSRLMQPNRRLVAMLPSTREEFAMFRAERSSVRLMDASFQSQTTGLEVPADQRASSGVAFLRDARMRPALWRDLILETTREVGLAELLGDNGFSGPEAERLAARIESQIGVAPDLAARSVLALRYRLRGEAREIIQLSLYGPEGYVGSLAMNPAGQLVTSADAWADQPLLDDLLARQGDEGAGRQRLLDLIYSAGLRNDVPPELIGEALAMMSKVYDLDSHAEDSDRLTLVYAPGTGPASPGTILFIGISGAGGDRPCYVVPAEGGEGFECYAPSARVQQRDRAAQLVPPVAGVLSRRFVPPADGAEEGRGQVVWSAPDGSPVMAAGSGRITARTVDESGATLEITHEGGMVSRYAGLAGLSASAAVDAQISGGTVIGTIGRTPGQSEPGLVFQLLSDGVPVDPMPYLSGAGEVLASDAIELLIGRIITVESAGNAAARNPLSSATGLGQFIESTWLRMMQSYRPDMARNLSRRELLDLRLDPDLSRLMVRHLAQENEAYLRAAGHAITPGRLYLAHFLGPAGADQALRADPGTSVGQVMGPAVVSANPFLRGWRIADLHAWADRKMAGAGAGHVAAVVAPPVSAEIRAYVSAMDRLRQAGGTQTEM
ncbi:Peptidase family M23 [Paracoccus alcaliphilus]|uniref:Peptidase family M23 n=1 Tax=Paracoccus alcaliphilus TaxID=34002 RepID=A0A1H8KTE4_9RHOB|nr:M23 family metallopeptidase [Paracoccus alcaliphilus]WCR20451.1 M23 family metallopeptidase [Paracoccus alcaliphilus]SEN95678.1 Peptidase family M23 [Paracoccus alcaliphilus]